MSLNVVRGLCEPSIIAFRDRFYLTIRNDIKGYVTASNDGLHYQPIKAWTFDDKYLDKPIPPDVFQQVLSAAMYAPSACNQQPWQFVVLVDRKLLREVPKINSYAAMAADAPVAILVCGDSSLETVPGYWVIDCSAAVQNLLLAAHALGLGAVWTGVYPQQERVHHNGW